MSLQKILLKHEPKPENLLKVLKEIQKENKYIGKKECEKVAEYFSLPLARVFSFASFFDEVETRKGGKKIIKVCSGGPCLMEDSREVVRQIELHLRIEAGNDAHPKYKLEFISCRGLCDQGPVVMVDDQVFERVRPEDVDDIIRNYL
ncbi:MAG: NAD(P)H-dependent oxidoreductase subunit E [Patescibacteria group bacterium]|nr:NAD(P)H-dependent oxidoreductase subunit E [Patescibacteria group bacterium]